VEKAFFNPDGKVPNQNAEALVRCLQSEEEDIREESLKLAVAIRDLGYGCSVLYRAGGEGALQTVIAKHGDRRAVELLHHVQACSQAQR
jgi:hypothetical protein